jgi:hypothetical protein
MREDTMGMDLVIKTDEETRALWEASEEYNG